MAPGLGLTKRLVIDQHFAQRHRIGRLFAAVALNPYLMGVGIDEDTAIVLDAHNRVQIIGHGTVTIIDGGASSTPTSTRSRTTAPPRCSASTVHVLTAGHGFDIDSRVPSWPEGPEWAEQRCRACSPEPAAALGVFVLRRFPSHGSDREAARDARLSWPEPLRLSARRSPHLRPRGARAVPERQDPRLRREAARRHALARRARLFVRRARRLRAQVAGWNVVRAHHRARRHRAAVPRGHARHLRQDAHRASGETASTT
jgi:hypothetical protein